MGDREKQSPEGQIHGPQFRVEVGDPQEVGARSAGGPEAALG